MNVLASHRFGSGPPLVLVPGWGMHSGVWGPFAEHLARRFRVVALDLPGYGASPPWPRWTLSALVDAVAAVERKALWLGWSLGGPLVLELARRHPERVAGLILMAGNPRFMAAADWPGMAAEAFRDFVSGMVQDPSRTLKRFLALVGQGASREAARTLPGLWRLRPPPSRETLLQGLALLAEMDLRSALTGIRTPVQVIGGRGDELVPAAALERTVARLPDARLCWVERGGHIPFLVAPECLADWIRDDGS